MGLHEDSNKDARRAWGFTQPRKARTHQTCLVCGFTLIEILIVSSLAVILLGLTTPIGLQYYQTQVHNESTLLVVDTLRNAEQKALFQKDDSAFGVFFEGASFTLFEGSSFSSRDQSNDEVFVLPESTTLSTDGTPEIVFSKGTGRTDTLRSITLSTGAIESTIQIEQTGKIDVP